MANEEVSTIFVAGFPMDATARELENLTRFMPGYVKSKLDTRRGMTLFAMFDSARNAHVAAHVLNNQSLDSAQPGEQVMRAVMAKSNMRTEGPTWGGQHAAPQSWTPRHVGPPVQVHAAPTPAWGGAGPPQKRPRIPESPANVDTVAVVGALEAGYDAATLEQFFSELPGFVAFKPQPRMGGGFAKFESAWFAAEAVASAEMHQVPAAIAKSSMNFVDGKPTQLGYQAEVESYTYAPATGYKEMCGDFSRGQCHRGDSCRFSHVIANGGWQESAKGAGGGHTLAALNVIPQVGTKRPRIPENPSHVDTVAIVGAFEAGHDETTLQAFFSELAGFVIFKPNTRMGGGFVKFQSSHLASQAIAAAVEQGIPAAVAKSSMSVVG